MARLPEKSMAPAFATENPELHWIEMRGMHNKMIHEYFDVDWNVVWATVKDHLPPLKKQMEVLLAGRRQLREGGDPGLPP